MKYGSGDVYEGEFVDGKKEGYGKLTLSKGRESFSYQGHFRNDKIDGEGELTYANGDTFKGSFTEGKKNGEGVYECKAKQETFEGHWDMDIKNGKFVEIKHKEQARVIGNFINGERHGIFVHEDFSGNKIK